MPINILIPLPSPVPTRTQRQMDPQLDPLSSSFSADRQESSSSWDNSPQNLQCRTHLAYWGRYVQTSVCQGVQSSMSGCSESVCPYVQSPYVMWSVSVCQGAKFTYDRVSRGCSYVRRSVSMSQWSCPLCQSVQSSCCSAYSVRMSGVQYPHVRKSSVCLSEDPVSVCQGFQCPSKRDVHVVTVCVTHSWEPYVVPVIQMTTIIPLSSRELIISSLKNKENVFQKLGKSRTQDQL
jgi:hypothetical protein